MEICDAYRSVAARAEGLFKDNGSRFIAFIYPVETEEEVREILRAAGSKKKVCAFSLFGSEPCYLRGALYNVIVGKELYPEWTMRFYVDDTVPREFRDALGSLDAEVLEQEDGQSKTGQMETHGFR